MQMCILLCCIIGQINDDDDDDDDDLEHVLTPINIIGSDVVSPLRGRSIFEGNRTTTNLLSNLPEF